MDLFVDYCFCTLAIGSRYHVYARELAGDLVKFAPGCSLVVLADQIEEFSACQNVVAVQHQQTGFFNCWNDKRFAIEKALSRSPLAIFVDADTRIVGPVPSTLGCSIGVTSTYGRNMLAQGREYLRPKDLQSLEKAASLLGLHLDDCFHVNENLLMVTRDGGRETSFLKMWGLVSRYLELHGYLGAEGMCIGLAAAATQWPVAGGGAREIEQVREHFCASEQSIKVRNLSVKLQDKLTFWRQLGSVRFHTLKENFL